MHVILAAALLLSVQWKTQKPKPVVVELWGGPPPAAPEQAQPEPVKQKPVKVEPAKPEVVPEKVDIATEKVKSTPKPTVKPTATPKVTAAPTATPKATAAPKATSAPVAKPTAAPKAKATVVPKKKDDDLASLLSGDNIMSSNAKSDAKPVAGGKPGGTGTNPNAAANSGPGKGSGANGAALKDYYSRLINLIDSRMVYNGPKGSSQAVYRVVLLPDGSILESQLELVSSSGNKAWDDAARRAILSVNPFPRLPDGQTFTGELRSFRLDIKQKN
ncbi:cell envelope integrity protein TolA [Chitinibacter tainanensis]|uniref:cell envelope integrity protein TolA n=1 Tax=Chitinibacter tainanensis TaxID=230667 RepID=UPI0023567A32|nr:cell envelope integrity protein TolA [Chitinibacter tainanensis]